MNNQVANIYENNNMHVKKKSLVQQKKWLQQDKHKKFKQQ
jgi:hypothetical protein